jgi:hypothetical protein
MYGDWAAESLKSRRHRIELVKGHELGLIAAT